MEMKMYNTINSAMAEGCYRLFWKECGTHGLKIYEKKKSLDKLCDLSLKRAYWQMEDDELTELFPELIPSNLCKNPTHHGTHLKTLSGLLLYTIHTEIADEIFALAKRQYRIDFYRDK